jgi:hypothetical protein
MATAAQEYRNKAAACLRLSKTMDDDNRRRLEDIARRWLEFAAQEEQGDRGGWKPQNEGRGAGLRPGTTALPLKALSLTSGVAIGS